MGRESREPCRRLTCITPFLCRPLADASRCAPWFPVGRESREPCRCLPRPHSSDDHSPDYPPDFPSRGRSDGAGSFRSGGGAGRIGPEIHFGVRDEPCRSQLQKDSVRVRFAVNRRSAAVSPTSRSTFAPAAVDASPTAVSPARLDLHDHFAGHWPMPIVVRAVVSGGARVARAVPLSAPSPIPLTTIPLTTLWAFPGWLSISLFHFLLSAFDLSSSSRSNSSEPNGSRTMAMSQRPHGPFPPAGLAGTDSPG